MSDKIKIDSIEQPKVNNDSREYPSNSKNNKEVVGDKRIQKVITGKVVERKKPLSKKVTEVFMGEGNDVKSVSEYVVKDILIPAAKGTFVDMIVTLGDMIRASVEISLFGSASSSNRSRGRNRSTGSSGKTYVSYDGYSKNNDRDRDRRPSADHNRASHSFDGIVLETRGEADEVIKCLIDLTLDYGVASVADLYDLVGIVSKFTDNEYGWLDLNTHNATFTRIREGYILNLPKTKPLN
jgi:hypothetical protein